MSATKSKLENSTSLNSGKKLLVLIVNNKGGVGKSVIARALTDTYRSSGKTVHVYDADGGTGSLLISYGGRDASGALKRDQNPATEIGYFDIRSDQQRAKLLDNLGTGADIILVDMAGGSLNEITRIVDDGDGVDGFIDAVEAQGYAIVLVHALSNVQAATQSVRDYLNSFGTRATHVAVVNKSWGKADDDFPFWYGFTTSDGVQKGGKARADLLEGGGKEIIFPALQSGTFAKVDAANLPFSKAETSPDLSITERAHLNKFNKAAREAFHEIKDVLGL